MVFLSKSSDFDVIHLEYSFSEVIPYMRNYDTRNPLGENVIQDEENYQEAVSHSSRCLRNFLCAFPSIWVEYGVQGIESVRDPLTGQGSAYAVGSSLSFYYEPKIL